MWARITFYGLDRNEHNEWTLPGISIIILKESHRGNIHSLYLGERGELNKRGGQDFMKPKIIASKTRLYQGQNQI